MEANVIEKLMSVQLQAQSMPVQPGGDGADEETDTFEPPLPAAIADMQRRQQRAPQRIRLSHGGAAPAEQQKVETVRRDAEKVGRNAPCPCGSGKKYKKCHGAAA